MNKSNHVVLVLAAVSLMFFALGVMTAGIGPLLSEFSVNTGASLTAVGGIYTGIFCGALLAQLVGGVLSEKMGMLRLSVAAAAVLILGLAGMTVSRSLFMLLAAALLAGLGHGTLNLAGNVMIGCLFREKNVSAVNFVNVFFGIGAIIGPALISLSLQFLHFGMPAMWCAAFFVLVAAVFMSALGRRITLQLAAESTAQSGQRSLFREPSLWAIAFMILIYVGTENAVGGWTTTYMQETVAYPIEKAALVTSGFWLALTLGRIFSSWLGARTSAYRVLAVSMAIAFGGASLFVLGLGVDWMSILAIFLMGFGFGGIYPTSMALTTSLFSYAPGKAGSAVTALGSIGGMLIPLLQGVALEFQGPRLAGWLLVVFVVVMIAIRGFAQRKLWVTKPG